MCVLKSKLGLVIHWIATRRNHSWDNYAEKPIVMTHICSWPHPTLQRAAPLPRKVSLVGWRINQSATGMRTLAICLRLSFILLHKPKGLRPSVNSYLPILPFSCNKMDTSSTVPQVLPEHCYSIVGSKIICPFPLVPMGKSRS